MSKLCKINGKLYESNDDIVFRLVKKTPKVNPTPEEESKAMYHCALKMKETFGEKDWHRAAIYNYLTKYKPVSRKARRKVCRCAKRK